MAQRVCRVTVLGKLYRYFFVYFFVDVSYFTIKKVKENEKLRCVNMVRRFHLLEKTQGDSKARLLAWLLRFLSVTVFMLLPNLSYARFILLNL